jgi:tRNA pseudouridine55 synthase
MIKKHKSRGRNVSGILLLDKPAGITSNQGLQQIKRIYAARKAGHTGSLDRQASGLLPICLGEATKLSGYLLNSDKHYLATCKLGIQTTTGDADGEKISVTSVPILTRTSVESVLSQFLGKIIQIPPMHSALKYKGQRLYKLAYQGIEVKRQPRSVNIQTLELLRLAEDEIELRISCSKGTYIRTLAEDIGHRLGCAAHVKKLRRTGVGPFIIPEMYTISDIELLADKGLAVLDQCLIAMDSILNDLPEVYLTENLAFYVRQGQAVIIPHAPTEGLVRIYDDKHLFMGVGEVMEDGRIGPRRLVNTG